MFSGYVPKRNAKEAIDNPVCWSMFTLTPVYSNNKYKLHSSSTGARVLSAEQTGK
jgi:hypothetical protein